MRGERLKQYGVMHLGSCLCHIAQCVGGEIEAVNETFEEILRGNLFRSFSDQASLPHFRVFAMSVGHPRGNCLSDKRMETAREMTEHLRLQSKVYVTRPEPMMLKELVHESQIRDQPVW